MASKQAKTLTSEQVGKILDYVDQRSVHPLRDTAIVLLSFKAGLRVAEIAGLRWRDVTDAFGELRSDTLVIPDHIAKKGSGRTIPMHPQIHAILLWLRVSCEDPAWLKPDAPIIRSLQGDAVGDRVCANTLQRYIGRLYSRLGLQGCSSHSGRRSFLTATARAANNHGCSLKDVQRLAGHRHIDTTERYVEASDTVADLVGAL
jgi:integrase